MKWGQSLEKLYVMDIRKDYRKDYQKDYWNGTFYKWIVNVTA